MRDIERAAAELVGNVQRLRHLLALEKQRRGLPDNRLAFVGMHNVAQHWWCTQQAVLASRADELTFFATHLHDRVVWAYGLGLIKGVPKRDDTVLDVGREITLADVERVQESGQHGHGRLPAGVDVSLAFMEKVDESGKRQRIINPDLPEAERTALEREAKSRRIELQNIETDPVFRGEVYHQSRAEKYPDLRWSFSWGKYTVVGVADGLTRDFVYEFKTTRSRYLLNFLKPVALAQADLYAYFFGRQRKRVQIHIVEEAKTETYDQPADIATAEQTLASFAAVDAGGSARPPRPWKCRACRFRAECPISQAK